jgi:hypothetical protein
MSGNGKSSLLKKKIAVGKTLFGSLYSQLLGLLMQLPPLTEYCADSKQLVFAAVVDKLNQICALDPGGVPVNILLW